MPDTQNTAKLFLNILSDFVNGRSTADVVISDDMLKYAKDHQVQPIVYHQTKNEKLSTAFYRSVFYYANRNQWKKKIAEEFDKESIRYYFVKGAAIAEHYPIPALRTMGDIDLHVRPEDKDRAAEVFRRFGFKEKTLNQSYEWVFIKDGIEFELHHSLMYDKDLNDEREIALMSDVWNHVEDSVLDRNYHFIYLLLHLKKHFLSCGVGFRQFMDLAVEVKYGDLDFEKVKQLAESAGILKFTGVCMALCERWFDVEAPFKENITEEFIASTTEKILSNGVFGYQNEENKQTATKSSVNKYGILRVLRDVLFIPYENLITMEEYGWLTGKRWLLPIAWIYRMFVILASPKKRKHGFKMLGTITNVSEVKATRGIYADWGIDIQ